MPSWNGSRAGTASRSHQSKYIFGVTAMNTKTHPKFAAIFKPGAKEPTEVTMNPVTMDFYASTGCRIEPLVSAEASTNAVITARAMLSIYQQCFSRGRAAKSGDKVMFDNGLFPLTPAEEHALMNVGIIIGGVFQVDTVFKKLGGEVTLSFVGAHKDRRFTADKFLVLPK